MGMGKDAERILTALRATPEGMTRSEIRRRVFGDNTPSDVISDELGMLLRLGLVRVQIIGTGGRPAERWFAGSGKSLPLGDDSRPPNDGTFHVTHDDHVPANESSDDPSLPDEVREKGRPDLHAAAPIVPEPASARPPSALRPVVAGWPIACRHRWADRAEALQAAGLPWDIAEYRAYRATVEEMSGA